MKKGFTLAEVLITLGIIGIVAAMTIPTLITKNSNNETAAKLKKFYTTFSQALVQYSNDNGCSGDLKCTGLFTGDTAADSLRVGEALADYFKIAKNCKMASDGKCFTTVTVMLNKPGTYTNIGIGYTYKFITIDGLSIAFYAASAGNCNWVGYGNPAGSGPLNSLCGEVYVDVNGIKSPNMYGKDVFSYVITGSSVLVPHGSALFKDEWRHWNAAGNETYRCQPDTVADNNGQGCAGRIMEEGWQKNY